MTNKSSLDIKDTWGSGKFELYKYKLGSINAMKKIYCYLQSLTVAVVLRDIHVAISDLMCKVIKKTFTLMYQNINRHMYIM